VLLKDHPGRTLREVLFEERLRRLAATQQQQEPSSKSQ
jgi:hypothetical protein